MLLMDQWAERHILDAQRNGEFDNLSGSGKPLILDDDSHVPQDLRSVFRLLKNAGCLPLELQQRKDAIKLADLLKNVQRDSAEYREINRHLLLLELKLRQAGINTDFLHGEYADRLLHKVSEEK